jgi:hypothetical protein
VGEPRPHLELRPAIKQQGQPGQHLVHALGNDPNYPQPQ